MRRTMNVLEESVLPYRYEREKGVVYESKYNSWRHRM